MAAENFSTKERAFVANILRGMAKGDAAVAAGYAESSASAAASRMLQQPKVKQALQEFYKREEEQVLADRERLRRRLMALAMADPSELYDDAWNLRDKINVPPAVRGLVINARKWDSLEQGSGSSAKVMHPLEIIKAYLKLFPAPTETNSGSLEDAAAEVEREMDELLERIQEDEADGSAS